jgi:hypothetical protein
LQEIKQLQADKPNEKQLYILESFTRRRAPVHVIIIVESPTYRNAYSLRNSVIWAMRLSDFERVSDCDLWHVFGREDSLPSERKADAES